jgi:hypothetical protein
MVAEAVTFFTGSVAKFEQRGNRSDRRCRYHFYADSYYKTIGA